MSGTSSSPSPPAYLLPGFEPAKAKVAELRGILLAHNIPYPSNAKKGDLVSLFKSKVVPLIPQLLAELSAVRASDDGVLDGDSLDGSLRELDTDPEEFAHQADPGSNASRRDAGKKKKSKRKSMVGRAHEAAAATDELEDYADEDDELASPRKKGVSKARRVGAPAVDEYEYTAEYDEVVPLAGEPSSSASPKKRKATATISGDESTPRRSTILKDRRRTIQSEGEAGFSDYNPFQSGGEDTPGRDPKRRKSSMGPDKLKERHSTTLESELAPPLSARASSSTSTSGKQQIGASSPAKPSIPSTSSSAFGRPDLTTANSWSSSTPEEARQRLLNPDGARRATMGSSSVSSKSQGETSVKGQAKARASVGGSGGASTPIGVKFMVPVEKVKTSPIETQRLMREYEDEQNRAKARKREEEEVRKKKDQELAAAEAELERLEREEMARQIERNEAGAMEVDDLELEQGELEDDPLGTEEMEVEHDELGVEHDPFEGGDFGQDEFEGEEDDEELFGESVPAPAPVLQALRQDRTSTPRRSEPLPYSPRKALLDAQQRHASHTPRRSFPLPTPPASASRRQLVPAITRPSKKDSQAISLRPTRSSVISRETVHAVKQVSGWTVLVLAIVYSLWWREEKLAVGFCDTNSGSNALVTARSTTTSLAVPALPSSLCATLDALGLRPTCTPCPAHGFCQDRRFAGCSIDYVPKASALRLGGLLPVPPTCVPDTEKLMVVALQASKASRLLRRRRGEVVCGGLERLRHKQISAKRGSVGVGIGDRDAFVYGLQADNVLTALMRENEASKSPFSEEVLEELNRLALNDLVNHGEVLTWQDGDDYWYASKTAEMTLSCQARIAAIRSAKKHKTGLAGVLSALMSIIWLRFKLQARVAEKHRVAELVQTALVQLQRQERSHHADPVLVPFPHIAPSHLRDLVLQHVHSPTRRRSLWHKVEQVVEGNSNVRVFEVEQNGEELRAWQWVGATTTTTATTGREIEAIEGGGGGGSSSSVASTSPEKRDRPDMFQNGKSVLNAFVAR